MGLDTHSCPSRWTVACQAPLSVGSPRQEYWSGLPCPPPGDLPDPGIKPTSVSPALQVESLSSELLGKHWRIKTLLPLRQNSTPFFKPLAANSWTFWGTFLNLHVCLCSFQEFITTDIQY